jgi:uncharacterized repeat protein (TIGR01451 family)
VQIIRPADQSSPQFLVRQGCTAVSWTDQTSATPVPMPAAPALPGPVSTSPPSTSPAPVVTPPPSARAAPPAVSVLELKITQRTAAVIGSNVTFGIELTNRGSTVARDVTVRDTFDPGLEPLSSSPGVDPHSTVPMEFHVFNLGPGETIPRSVTFRVTKPGQLCHRMEAVASDGGHTEQRSCVTAVAPATTNPTPPAATYPGTNTSPPSVVPATPPLEIKVTSQAATAAVGQSVVFTANIRNLAQQPLANVRISQQSEAALFVTNCTDGAIRQGTDCVWNLPSLPPGREIKVQVQCKCRQVTPKACCRFMVESADSRPVAEQACVEITAANPPPSGTGTAPSPAAAPSRLVVSVGNRNTVHAGSDQQFLVFVGNDGDAVENDIVVKVNLPRDSMLVSAAGPDGVTYRQQPGVVTFSPIAELPPTHARPLSFRVTVTTSKSGPINLEAEATSRWHPQPVPGSATVEVLP